MRDDHASSDPGDLARERAGWLQAVAYWRGIAEAGTKVIEEVTAERDEARAAVEHAYREGGALYEAEVRAREAEQGRAEAIEAFGRARSAQRAAKSTEKWLRHIIDEFNVPERPVKECVENCIQTLRVNLAKLRAPAPVLCPLGECNFYLRGGRWVCTRCGAETSTVP